MIQVSSVQGVPNLQLARVVHGSGLVGVLHGGNMGADSRHVGARANLWRCAAGGGPAQVWWEDM